MFHEIFPVPNWTPGLARKFLGHLTRGVIYESGLNLLYFLVHYDYAGKGEYAAITSGINIPTKVEALTEMEELLEKAKSRAASRLSVIKEKHSKLTRDATDCIAQRFGSLEGFKTRLGEAIEKLKISPNRPLETRSTLGDWFEKVARSHRLAPKSYSWGGKVDPKPTRDEVLVNPGFLECVVSIADQIDMQEALGCDADFLINEQKRLIDEGDKLIRCIESGLNGVYTKLTPEELNWWL